MVSATSVSTPHMMRDVDWKQVVFIAAGVPALVLFSMGGISATVGAPAWLVWTISVLFGFAREAEATTAFGPAVFIIGTCEVCWPSDIARVRTEIPVICLVVGCLSVSFLVGVRRGRLRLRAARLILALAARI